MRMSTSRSRAAAPNPTAPRPPRRAASAAAAPPGRLSSWRSISPSTTSAPPQGRRPHARRAAAGPAPGRRAPGRRAPRGSGRRAGPPAGGAAGSAPPGPDRPPRSRASRSTAGSSSSPTRCDEVVLPLRRVAQDGVERGGRGAEEAADVVEQEDGLLGPVDQERLLVPRRVEPERAGRHDEQAGHRRGEAGGHAPRGAGRRPGPGAGPVPVGRRLDGRPGTERGPDLGLRRLRRTGGVSTGAARAALDARPTSRRAGVRGRQQGQGLDVVGLREEVDRLHRRRRA